MTEIPFKLDENKVNTCAEDLASWAAEKHLGFHEKLELFGLMATMNVLVNEGEITDVAKMFDDMKERCVCKTPYLMMLLTRVHNFTKMNYH